MLLPSYKGFIEVELSLFKGTGSLCHSAFKLESLMAQHLLSSNLVCT